MIIWCDNIDTKEFFSTRLKDQIFLCTLNYGFFPLSPFFNESNNLESHISNLNYP